MLPEILVGWVRGEGIRESTFGGVGVGVGGDGDGYGKGIWGEHEGAGGNGERFLPPPGSNPRGATLGSGPAVLFVAEYAPPAFDLNFARGCGGPGDPAPNVSAIKTSMNQTRADSLHGELPVMVVCAWCEKGKAQFSSERDPLLLVSHGICGFHLREELAAMEVCRA